MLKKRTAEQINNSVANGDYTGGYKFLPWLIFVDKNYIRILASMALLASGIYLFMPIAMQKSFNPTVQIVVAIACFVSAAAIFYLTVRMYKRLKKGISD